MNKNYRQSRILKLIRTRRVHTQQELARALRSEKIPATQVTLSRDIRELGLVKTPEGYAEVGGADTPDCIPCVLPINHACAPPDVSSGARSNSLRY